MDRSVQSYRKLNSLTCIAPSNNLWIRFKCSDSMPPCRTSSIHCIYLVDKHGPLGHSYIEAQWRLSNHHFDGLVQEKRNSIANALELRFFTPTHRIVQIMAWHRTSHYLNQGCAMVKWLITKHFNKIPRKFETFPFKYLLQNFNYWIKASISNYMNAKSIYSNIMNLGINEGISVHPLKTYLLVQ